MSETVALIQERLNWINQWAEDRNLILGSNPKAQFAKLQEEAGEISSEILSLQDIPEIKDNPEDILRRMKDGIGDTIVVATIIAAQYVYQNGPENNYLKPEYLDQVKYFEENFDYFACDIDTVDWKNYDTVHPFVMGLHVINTYISTSLGEIAGRIARGKSLEDNLGNEYLGALCYWLSYLAYCCNFSIVECLDKAWDDIKDRKGRMVDGAFIKEEDLIKMGLTD